jgi:hypothetical protein
MVLVNLGIRANVNPIHNVRPGQPYACVFCKGLNSFRHYLLFWDHAHFNIQEIRVCTFIACVHRVGQDLCVLWQKCVCIFKGCSVRGSIKSSGSRTFTNLTNLKNAVRCSVRVWRTFKGSVELCSMCLSKWQGGSSPPQFSPTLSLQ